ncbi:MAG: RloB family protein [Gammaproteobacteria bacterium]|nr:RloB family protein [Gammaproteobacteria bacterium]MCY4218687.1 RloB family protein [Gammaproteobacteria bacterium]MCY4273829.1 RloB family protein [Gammaproteobacteria bacterium]
MSPIKVAKRQTGRIGRRGSSKEPKVLFTLFCEGENTGPANFSAIRKFYRDALVSIESHDGVGGPITIAEKALKFAKSEGLARGSSRKQNLFEKRDQVWVVFDRDEHERYQEAVNLCETNGIGVAR